MRYLYSIPTDSPDSGAASRCRHLKKIFNYTDYHDVDEDVRTISSYGGLWMYDGGRAGITARNLYSSSLILDGAVASVKNKD